MDNRLTEEYIKEIHYFSKLWRYQRKNLSAGQKSRIARLYLNCILGVPEATVEEFMEGNNKAEHEVGLLEAGLDERKNDYKSFWEGIREITPEVYPECDMNWLAEFKLPMVSMMLLRIDSVHDEQSVLMGKIRRTALFYRMQNPHYRNLGP